MRRSDDAAARPLPRRAALAAGLLTLAAGPRAEGCSTGAAGPAAAAAAATLRDTVADRERAFAATMARRDGAAFATFVSEEAVFLNGGDPLTGRAAIVAHWARYFEGASAPFAWEPDLVAVLASGQLATTAGPVTMPDGTNPMRFYSTWRREGDGAWRIVFDNGYRVSRCAQVQG
jgi:uncharacterized protein (TIGR02246 family)